MSNERLSQVDGLIKSSVRLRLDRLANHNLVICDVKHYFSVTLSVVDLNIIGHLALNIHLQEAAEKGSVCVASISSVDLKIAEMKYLD